MILKINDLNMTFPDGNQVLKNINFEDDISTLALIGPSGGGKTTLLRILGGLLIPQSGDISFDNVQVPNKENKLIEYRRSLGYVFQQNGLFKHMNSLDNIAKPLMIVHNKSKEEAYDIARDLLDKFGLSDAQRKLPSELSGGQQQRVAIARAIAAKPKVLLLDEPTSALDPEYTTEVLNTVSELAKEGIKFIIVTHEMGFARHACEKIAFLCNNTILEYGDSEQMFASPKNIELKNFFDKLLSWKV